MVFATTVGVDGEDTVPSGRLAGVVGELHLQGTAEEVGEGGEHGHPGGELEPGIGTHPLRQKPGAEPGEPARMRRRGTRSRERGRTPSWAHRGGLGDTAGLLRRRGIRRERKGEEG